MTRKAQSDTYQGLTNHMLLSIRGERERRAFFRQQLVKRANRRCPVCEKPLNQMTAFIELVVPESEGGTYTWENVRAVHGYCARGEHHDRKYGVQAAVHEGIV